LRHAKHRFACRDASDYVAGREACQRRGHFLGCVRIAGSSRGLNPRGQNLPGFGVARQAHVELTELKISGDIIRIRAEQDIEILDGRIRIAQIGAFDGQCVSREGIIWLYGDKLLKLFTA
jgi:hypothetical protein